MLDIDTNDLYISECCFAHPATELDMSTVNYGGPSGFCSRCHDNCIFEDARYKE